MAKVEDIIDYEEGRMDDDEVIAFFQDLINTGEAWRLQGHYGRMAMTLINDGLCFPPKENTND